MPSVPDDKRAPDASAGLTDDELANEQGTELPDREAMSMLHILPFQDIDNLSMPINQAFAMNVNTNQSIASADASQVVVSDQTDAPST
jgi:hypothetical protein